MLKKHDRRSWVAGLIGVTLGALILLISLPFIENDEAFSAATVTDLSENESNTEIPEKTDTTEVTSDVTTAVQKASDAVVGIFNLQRSRGLETQNAGSGSGVIYKKEGDKSFIVTNNHVIQDAENIEVGLSDEKRVQAELVGTDPLTDLAVLSVSSEHVDTVAEFSNSDNLSVGEPAIAIGNPLGSNLDGTVTQGIISALDRSIPVDLNGDGQTDWSADVLQTDAAINPGNSGGALINIQGKVIGINSMKIAQSAVEGIGFAIPSNVVLPVLKDLEDNGKVERPQLGVTIGSLNQVPSYHWKQTLKLPAEVKEGVYITSVLPGSPAEEAGLQQYDVITSLHGKKVANGHELREILYKEVEVSEKINITFYRNGEKRTTSLTLGESKAM